NLPDLRNVTTNEGCAPRPVPVQLFSQARPCLLIAGTEDNAGPRRDKCSDASLANAFRASGYEHGLAFVSHRPPLYSNLPIIPLSPTPQTAAKPALLTAW